MSAPFRIRHPRLGLHQVSGTTQGLQDYFERLMKMIPGEVVGLYLVGSGFIPRQARPVLVLWSAVCLFGVVAIRAWGTTDVAAARGPQWPAVWISTVAFLIWLYTIGGPFAAYGISVPYVGSLLVLTWTFFVPIFYHGD